DLTRQVRARGRHGRLRIRAACEHEGPAAPCAANGCNAVAAFGRLDPGHPRAGQHRRADHRAISLDHLGELPRRHEAVRIRAVIAKSRQAALPARRQQPQRVPALVPPCVRDLAALEHDVLDAALGEAAAHREPAMPRADDDDVNDAGHRRPPLTEGVDHATSTATFVGFVTISNTAERFCDWATRAAISSRDASASISKRTLIPSKPLRTSASMPRMPWMSMPASTVAVTERS